MKTNSVTYIFKTLLITAVLIFVIAGNATASFEMYGKIETELGYDDFITNPVNQGFTGKILFAPNFNIVADNVTGFVGLKGTYNNDIFGFTANKAYVSYMGDSYCFKIGKDRTLKGVAYAWNPADIINPQRSPLYRDDEKRGSDEGIFLTSFSTFGKSRLFDYELSGLLIPGKDYSLKKVLSMKLGVGSFESFLVGGFQSGESIYGGYLRFPVFDFLTAYSEFQTVNFQSQQKYLLGIQTNPTLPYIGNPLQIHVEYFKNIDGALSMNDYFINHPGEIPILGETLQNYLYTGLVYNDVYVRASLGGIWNIDDDKSGLINFLISFFPTKESMIRFGGYYCFFSDSQKEFPRLTDTQCEIYINFSVFFGTQ